MASVGYATLQVIPSVRGIGDELRRQLVGPAGDAADAAGQESGSRFGDRWKAGLAVAGAAAGAVLVAATVSAVEKEKAGDRLAAQLGLSGKGAKRAGDVAGKLYSGAVVDSFEDGAAAVRAVMGSGLVDEKATGRAIESITTKVADLAGTFDQDLTGTANAAAQMIRTGLAKDGDQALDLLTKGFQSSADKAGDFLDTINEYGVQFRKAGLDGSTAVGLLNQAIKAGARDADIAADAVKEFSIRAVDGSDSSKAGFKALGLSASDMADRFAKGGKSANGVLDQTLDRLRGVKDPVKQSQIAVQLFGTQAEDLGEALYAMDPSSAAKDLGKFGGAAKKVGDTIRGNTSTELKILQRQVMGAFGSVVTAVVLPALRGLITAIQWTGDAAAATGRWFSQWGIWLLPVGILITGITIALNAQAIATGTVIGVMGVYALAVRGVAAVTRAWAAAQAVFNAVMALNPFVLAAIAVVALGAALVVAWKRSETFRTVVQAMWAGIQMAAMTVWTTVLKPVLDGFMAGLRAVGAAALWLWNSAISPVFSFISTAARILLTVLTIVVFGPIYLAIRLFGATFMWLYNVAVGPSAKLIGAVLRGMGAGIMAVVGLVVGGLRRAGAAALWLYNAAVAPVVRLVVAGLRVMWAGVKVVLAAFVGGLRSAGGAAKSLWTSYVAPAMTGIKSVISTVINTGVRPVLGVLRSAIGKTGEAFDAARRAIKTAWDKVKGIARGPVEFIVNTVYNRGIVGVWNKVASAFGAPTLNKHSFATGGPVFGAGTETSDDVPAWLSKNEHVWTAREVRGAGGHSGVAALRKWAAAGGHGRLPGFKGGGAFGWVSDAASAVKGVGSDAWDKIKSGAGWLRDTVAGSLRSGIKKVIDPLINRIPGLDNGWGKAVKGVPTKILDTALGYSEKADGQIQKQFIPVGGSGVKRWSKLVLKALAMVGQPASLLGVTLRRMNQESGGNARAINEWDINAKRGMASRGLMQVIPPTFNAYAGRLRKRGIWDPLANIYASMRYALSVYGSLSRAYNRPGGYANGGSPRPGEIAWVGEQGPELIRFGAGGATVWDHRTSMSMAGGLAGLRGFAKGTRRTGVYRTAGQEKARKELPGDLSGVTKALTASAADIKRAFDALTKDLRAAGGAGRALATSSTKASAKLQSLAKQRDSVEKRLEEARSAAADQKKSAADYFGLGSVGEVATFSDLLGSLKKRQADARAFQKQISTLSKKGVSRSIISQLVAAGPDGPLADLIGGASKNQLSQLNKIAASGGKLSTSYGNTMADAMFDAGSQAGKGFLTGLKAQEKELQKAMDRLGSALVKSIRRRLKIKSPSKVTQYLGEMTGAGVGVGLDNTAAAVAASAARLADAATPAMPTVSPASLATTRGQAGVLGAGGRLWLVLEDGRELAAYVDDRADGRVGAGFARARRAQHAGSK
ncbi:phage tail tape measure protein [Streptomyces aureocirculatus]|uniref:phage tail tape measure protein n=1 Tax=Streptomyces aureocirculatus TaxID=67275 RepID=UPI00068EB879|nr:phage tail tape measure protein [Streptomyces aureocirculatus]